MRSPAGVDAWMRDPANFNRHQGGPWHNECEQFTNNAGAFTQTFGTAWLAARASGPLDSNINTIRNGELGFWRGVWIDGVECGHTAFWWNGRWMMASDAVTERVGNGTGTITHADYRRLRPAAIWQGHTFRHGTETLDLTSTAGGGTTPLEGDDDMKISFINTTNGKTWVLGPAGIKYVSDPTHVGLLQRAAGTLASESDKMLEGEIAIVNSYLLPAPASIDLGAVSKAITDAIAAHPATAILDAKTQAALVAAQVTALAPAFAAVNANVDQIPLGFDLTPKH